MTLQVFVYLFTFHQSPQQPYIPVVASYFILFGILLFLLDQTKVVSNVGGMFTLTYMSAPILFNYDQTVSK